MVEWRDAWLQKGIGILRSLGLPAQSDVASDPFFGRGGKVLGRSQLEQRLKFEVLVPVISLENPTAVCSFNFHQEHFGGTFDIRTADGNVANTACLGFGLERVTMALFKTHGFDPERWPAKYVTSSGPAATPPQVPLCALRGLWRRLSPHPLHAEDRIWVEKNCYVDVWIELLHALGLEPLAMLPFIVAIDFEGDHWTFFKPRHDELRVLYGIDVQELNVWRPLIEHVREHVAAGKLVAPRPTPSGCPTPPAPTTGGTTSRPRSCSPSSTTKQAPGLLPQRRLF